MYFLSSDGAGRSGVYIAIDANIELSEEDGVFDVYGYLKKIRQQRRGLVETLVGAIFPISNGYKKSARDAKSRSFKG